MKTKKKNQEQKKGFKTEVNKFKDVTSLVGFGFLFLTSLKAVAGVPTGGLPQGYKTVAGDVQFQENKNVLNVNSGSDRAIVEYNSFSVGKSATVNFNLPNNRSAILNRVVGDSASEIMGKINSNGQVFLVNPNGIIFGTTAQVNVSSLIASTLDISNKDFLKGNLIFENKGFKPAGIKNEGKITVEKGGSALILGGAVSNKGTIKAPDGQIHMAVGEKISVKTADGVVLDVTVDRELKQSVENFTQAISNTGTLDANQYVKMQAKVANNVYDQVINNEGVIRANGISEENGTIELTAEGNAGIKIGGKLYADNLKVQNDGDILLSNSADSFSEIVKLQDGNAELISTNGNITINDRLVVDGKGNILLSAAQNIDLDSARDNVDELLRTDEGSISLKANSSIKLKDRIKSSSGSIELTALDGVNVGNDDSVNSTLISTSKEGSIDLTSNGNISIGDSISTQNGIITASSKKGNIEINDSSEKVNTLLTSSGKGGINLIAENGDVNLKDAIKISRGDINIKAGGSINLSDGQNDSSSKLISADYESNVSLQAQNAINVHDQISTRDGDINIKAREIQVFDDTGNILLNSFRGNVAIDGEQGKLKIDQASIKTKYGKVNIQESEFAKVEQIKVESKESEKAEELKAEEKIDETKSKENDEVKVESKEAEKVELKNEDKKEEIKLEEKVDNKAEQVKVEEKIDETKSEKNDEVKVEEVKQEQKEKKEEVKSEEKVEEKEELKPEEKVEEKIEEKIEEVKVESKETDKEELKQEDKKEEIKSEEKAEEKPEEKTNEVKSEEKAEEKVEEVKSEEKAEEKLEEVKVEENLSEQNAENKVEEIKSKEETQNPKPEELNSVTQNLSNSASEEENLQNPSTPNPGKTISDDMNQKVELIHQEASREANISESIQSKSHKPSSQLNLKDKKDLTNLKDIRINNLVDTSSHVHIRRLPTGELEIEND